LGLELPVTLLNEAPCFAALCAVVRGRPARNWVPLVLLKRGEGAAPVFFVHGLGGNVAELFQLARAMAWPGPVFGIQARGLSTREPPHRSVEAMAAAYLAAIRALFPRGPYNLCGYSFGGLVAFEMARRLAEAGDEIGLVGLIDTLPRAVPRRSLGLALEGLLRLLERTPAELPPHLKSAPAAVVKTVAASSAASARYRPGYYPGDLTLFTPAERDRGLPGAEALWRPHANAFASVELPGGHLTMISPPNDICAAEALSRCLGDATRR
jgi:thioesterase domain-containing protein